MRSTKSADPALVAAAVKLSDVLQGAIAMSAGRSTVDARVVVTACAMVAGSYAFGILDPEIKRALVDVWVAKFRAVSGVPEP